MPEADRRPPPPWHHRWRQGLSMRSRLLLGILLPVGLLVALNTVVLYRQALQAADTAYDRTLLASAKAIGELLDVAGTAAPGQRPTLRASVPYSALEAFEADNRSRIYFKVSGFEGEMVSGFEDLPTWHGTLPARSPYAALVDFYDDHYRGEPVRMAVLLQPVAGTAGQGMATIQVAETLELRQSLARQMLIATLWQQAVLLAVIGLGVSWVVHRATRPVRELSAALQARRADDLSPIDPGQAPRELQPLIDATNGALARLAALLTRQKRLVRDASHQLRTPLAVLKTQVQSARRGDLPAALALQDIDQTVDGAIRLAHQLLALAKIEQAQHDQPATRLDLAALVREVTLDLAPLIADKALDFELDAPYPAPVHAHDWMLRELTRNLLHNAIRATPPGAALWVGVSAAAGVPDDLAGPVRTQASASVSGPAPCLRILDRGPGLTAAQREHLFEPFHTGHPGTGTGLGLSICREVCERLGGQIQLADAAGGGLEARVWLPAAAPELAA
jgi:two-component system, OmpR family, sensor histidine kinase TctE